MCCYLLFINSSKTEFEIYITKSKPSYLTFIYLIYDEFRTNPTILYDHTLCYLR